MLHDVPVAHHYFLVPMQEFKNAVEDYDEENAVFVGSAHVMNELAVYMDDEMVIGNFGIGGLRCMLLVDMGRKECEDRAEMARMTFDKKLKESGI